MADRMTVLTCALDRAGVPDLSDLQRTPLEIGTLANVEGHVAIDGGNTNHPRYYPYAEIRLKNGARLIAPGDSESRHDAAAATRDILVEGLAGYRPAIASANSESS